MLKNPHYVYGSQDIMVPLHLNFGQFILEKMNSYKDKVALTNGATGESVTYKEMVQRSMRFAISLTQLGVRKGETIAIFSDNRHEYWTAVIGSACVAAIITTISTGYNEVEIKHAINISKPKYLIISPTMHEKHENYLKTFDFIEKIIVFGDVKPNSRVYSFNELSINSQDIDVNDFIAAKVDGQNDVLFVIYSSGTTGSPKGVLVTHLNVIRSCCLPPTFDPETPSLIIRSPWFHVMGLVGALTRLSYGRNGVYLEKFEVEQYLKTIEKYKLGQLLIVPQILTAVCKSKTNYDLSSVKLVYSGSVPLHKDTIEATYKKFPNLKGVLQAYGSAETTSTITRYVYTDLDRAKPGSVGLVTPGTTVKVLDIVTRKPLGPNQQGEICVSGSLLMKGYIGRDRAEDFDGEDFFKTGDVGYYDEDGHFFIVARLKELIKYKRFLVSPVEIEAVLLQHEAVKDAGVIGVENRAAGEVPLAFVVLQPGKSATEQEIKDFVAGSLSEPKHLRGGIQFVNEIPKNPSGKVLRKELKKLVSTSI